MDVPLKSNNYKDLTKLELPKKRWTGYGIALGTSSVAFLVRAFLDPYFQDSLPYLTFFFAIALTTWYSGVGPSLAAFVLGGMLANWFFVAPRYEFAISGPVDQAGLAVYVTIGFAMIGFVQTWRWAWRRTDELAAKLQYELHREDQPETKPADVESSENVPTLLNKL